MDLVEADGGVVTPVDYKHGHPRESANGLELWPSDRAQLAVQGIVLRRRLPAPLGAGKRHLGRPGFARMLFGGWSLRAIARPQTGPLSISPLTVRTARFRAVT